MTLTYIAPQVPTGVSAPPDGSDWVHEIKHDGFRTLIAVEDGTARAFTRNGYDWSERYVPVMRACSRLKCRSALLDGEIVVEDENSVSDFDGLSWTIHHEPYRLVFFAFDLLHLDGQDLRQRALIDRRHALADVIPTGSVTLRYSEHFSGDGGKFFKAACDMGLEGIVSKKSASFYKSGPSRQWLKTKNTVESEFLLLGFESDDEGHPFAHVGIEAKVGIAYAGMAFMTVKADLSHLVATSCPVPGLRRPRATWLKPETRVRVRHLRTSTGLRHASVRAVLD